METRDTILIGELKAEPLRVMAKVLNVRQLQINEALISSSENLRAVFRFDLLSGRGRVGELPVSNCAGSQSQTAIYRSVGAFGRRRRWRFC